MNDCRKSAILADMLRARLNEEQWQWLEQSAQKSGRMFHLALAQCPRRLGKQDLQPGASELAAAAKALPGWSASEWSVDQCARVWLIAQLPEQGFLEAFTRLVHTGDVREHMAYFSGLPFYPAPKALVDLAADGLRSNVSSVFCAIAQRNPFPAAHFPEHAWNQMILKAVFIGAELAHVVAVDARNNVTLATMLHNYVRERRAANRSVPGELWRCIIPCAPDELLEEILPAWQTATGLEKEGMARAFKQRGDTIAKSALAMPTTLLKSD